MALHMRFIGSIALLQPIHLLTACPGDDDGNATSVADDDDSAGTDPSMTSASATDSTGTATAESGPVSAGSGSADSGSDTGTSASTCTIASDCVVVDDCCTCGAFHVDEVPGACDLDCDQSACGAQNLHDVTAACVFGHCEIADVACNQATVACDATPPTCGEGSLPSVVDGCWGSCVPAEVCDVVPDCSACPDDETCIEHSVGFAGLLYTCEPIAPDCDGAPSCACMPGVCDMGADTCVDGEGTITCACPEC